MSFYESVVVPREDNYSMGVTSIECSAYPTGTSSDYPFRIFKVFKLQSNPGKICFQIDIMQDDDSYC